MKKRRAGGTGVFLRMELFAAVRIGATQHQIRLVSLAGQPAREITVKDWNNFMSLDWAADGKGFFISSNPTGRLDTVLYLDLAGTATPLWQVKNFQAAWRFLRTKESTWPFRRLRRSTMFGWLKILEATRLSDGELCRLALFCPTESSFKFLESRVPHKVRCSSAPGTYTPYSLFSDVASPIRQGLWHEFSSWQILLFWTETAGRIGGSFVD